MKISYFIFFR